MSKPTALSLSELKELQEEKDWGRYYYQTKSRKSCFYVALSFAYILNP